MTEPIIIFKVNDIKEYGGYANRLTLFIDNLNKISPSYYIKFKNKLTNHDKEQLVVFESMGRYIMMIEMKKDWSAGQTLFMDFMKNDEIAMKFMSELLTTHKEEELAKQFVFTYQHNKKKYDEYYDLVKLELDEGELN